MNVLVTGGAGFIGSYVVQNLLDRGDTVFCVDNFNDHYNPELKEHRLRDFEDHKNLKLYRADITNNTDMEKIFNSNKIDKVIHLAALAGVRQSLKNPILYKQVNISGTLNLLELSRKHQVQNFVFASSSSVYGGNAKMPSHEDNHVNKPISLYAATKRAGELICYTYHHTYKMPITCLRFFTVYGPKSRPDMALYKFALLMKDNMEIPVYGKGEMNLLTLKGEVSS